MQSSSEKVRTITYSLEKVIDGTLPPAAALNDFYVFSYPHLVSGFAKVTKRRGWTLEEVINRFASMYAWMPTSVKSYNLSALAALPPLLNARAPVAEVLPVAARCLSNSVVAGAKFTHMYAPHEAPMFDSLIEGWAYPDTSSVLARRAPALQRYAEFQKGTLAVSTRHQEKAQSWAKAAFGYAVSPIRAVEALAFYYVKTARSDDAVRGNQPPFPANRA